MTVPGDGRLQALSELYEAHHRQALGLAYRMLRNTAEAEEVVQEAFLTAWRAANRYDPARGSERTWLLTLVRNRSIDSLRARQRKPTVPMSSEIDPSDPADVQATAASNVDGAVARAAVAELPPEQRQVIELAYFQGLTHSEIAQLIPAPLGTVKGRIRLALDRLRLALGVQQDAFSLH